MSYTGQDFISSVGTLHPILRGSDRKYYLADPEYHLPGPHKLFSEPYFVAPPGSGLGDATVQAGIQAAAVAANFIPVVGPFVSAALSVGGALFGGGDPTPLSTLIQELVDLREQIAQTTNAIAGAAVDPFTVPANFNAQDKAGTASLVEGIVESVLGVTAAHIQKNRRADYYAAIKALQTTLSQIQTQGQIRAGIAAALISPTVASSTSAPVAAPSTIAASSTSAASDYNSVVALAPPPSNYNSIVALAPPSIDETASGDTAAPVTAESSVAAPSSTPTSSFNWGWLLAGGAIVAALALAD